MGHSSGERRYLSVARIAPVIPPMISEIRSPAKSCLRSVLSGEAVMKVAIEENAPAAKPLRNRKVIDFQMLKSGCIKLSSYLDTTFNGFD